MVAMPRALTAFSHEGCRDGLRVSVLKATDGGDAHAIESAPALWCSPENCDGACGFAGKGELVAGLAK